MSRADPHAGKYPQPPERVVEPGTPEHAVWVLEQTSKRIASEEVFQRRGEAIGRPAFWSRG